MDDLTVQQIEYLFIAELFMRVVLLQVVLT